MKKLIRQDNTITNARYDFTACQLDILFSTLSQINDDDSSSKVYIIYARQIEQITGRKWQYSQFREATESMGSRIFEIKAEKEYTQFWLFQYVKYVLGEGRIEVVFSIKAMEMLKQLKSNFTTYELQSALSMSSKYAKRIYQMCSQWKDVGQSRKFDIYEFKTNLGLIDKNGNEQFRQIVELKKNVLDIAIKQINNSSDLEVSYTLEGENGKKRPFKYLTFYITRKDMAFLPVGFENIGQKLQSLMMILDNLGIKAASIRKSITDNDDMIKEVFSFNYQLQTGKIKPDKNAGGLLLKKLGLV